MFIKCRPTKFLNKFSFSKTSLNFEIKLEDLFTEFSLEKEKEMEAKKILKILKSNWYETVEDLKELSDEDALKLKIPHRFLKMIKSKINELSQKTEMVKMDFDNQHFPPFKSFSVSKKERNENYSLKEINHDLKLEIENFIQFMTTNFIGQQEIPVRKVTANSYVEKILLILGWMKNVKHLEFSSFRSLFPDSSQDSVALTLEYLNWLREERKIGASYEVNITRALLKLAKFMFHKESKNLKSDKTYNDIPLVIELRSLVKDSSTRRKNSPKSTDESLKVKNQTLNILVVRI
jgi:hypothetical protein